ncbi:MAG: hypothetical protein P4M00_23490 [Azospirillaceae bacterium]|nr:hypothetical protein [Azospirillaceae bacterium]
MDKRTDQPPATPRAGTTTFWACRRAVTAVEYGILGAIMGAFTIYFSKTFVASFNALMTAFATVLGNALP